jgi:two-component system chemotaxis response regulator CheB
MSINSTSSVRIPDASAITHVMVVDDSAVIRGFITRELESDPAVKVVASANNGQAAIDTLRRVPADVVILDIEMPVMDGLTAIPKLKEIDPATQIVMASTLTHKNAEVSLKALTLGATDYIAKPSSQQMAGADSFHHELVEKVKILGAIARRKGVRQGPQAQASAAVVRPRPAGIGATAIMERPPTDKKHIVLRPMPISRPEIIAIGSSTGGPQALFEVIKSMGANLSQPIVITQHMPPSFTTILAQHISRQCGVTCTEAADGEALRAGCYYVAPGDFHMLISRKGDGPTVKLVKDPAENFCRPSVDPMLRSLVDVYAGRILIVMLTGMGQDGWKGSDAVVKAGGAVLAQDEASSVVWGMPGAVSMSGLCSAVLPLTEIGATVRQIAGKA